MDARANFGEHERNARVWLLEKEFPKSIRISINAQLKSFWGDLAAVVFACKFMFHCRIYLVARQFFSRMVWFLTKVRNFSLLLHNQLVFKRINKR